MIKYWLLPLFCRAVLASNVVQIPMEQMRVWGFTFVAAADEFNQLSNENVSSCSSACVSGLIPVLMDESKLTWTEDEIHRLVNVGDALIATGQSLRRILAVLIDFLATTEINLRSIPIYQCHFSFGVDEFPVEEGEIGRFCITRFQYLWPLLVAQIREQSNAAISVDNDCLTLEGENVTPRSSAFVGGLFANLLQLYSVFQINDMPLDSAISHRINWAFHIGIRKISFKECSFSVVFDFTPLSTLSSFELLGAVGIGAMPLLSTVNADSLLHLHISQPQTDAELEAHLMDFVMQCNTLESLTVSLGESEYISIVDGRVLLLPRLRHLQLNSTADVASVAERLSFIDAQLDLTHLDLSGDRRFAIRVSHTTTQQNNSYVVLIDNLFKMPRLSHLNLSGGRISSHLDLLLGQLEYLPCLEELVVDSSLEASAIERLRQKIYECIPHFKTLCTSLPIWVERPHQIYFLPTIHLREIFPPFALNESGRDFDSVTSLSLCLSNFPLVTSPDYLRLFGRFKRITSLEVSLFDIANCIYLARLLATNPISQLEVKFYKPFRFTDKLFRALARSKFTGLTLERFDEQDYASIGLVTKLFRSEGFLSKLTEVKFIKFPFQSIASFLGCADLHKLRSISLQFFDNYPNELDLKQIESVREVELVFSMDIEVDHVKLDAFLALFPGCTRLRIDCNSIIGSPRLEMPNLRRVVVKCGGIVECDAFMQRLAQLKFLSHVEVYLLKERTSRLTCGRHALFESLLFSHVFCPPELIERYFQPAAA